MKELVEFIARSLVENPDAVRVKTRRSGSNLHVRVTASPEDTGRLIGRRGRTAQAIRSVVKVAGMRRGLRVTVDID
ncbi:MAG: KH domain-containing protein [Caldilineae bacterium]|nr:MAG: KH domain-containing protein [Caldilineae bacterium]